MQVQTIQSPSVRKPSLLVHQVFPQFIGILRPHLGHRMIIVMEQGIPIVKCADCNQALTGTFYNPRVLECVGQHIGHRQSCEMKDNEVFVTCDCGKDVVGSTPF